VVVVERRGLAVGWSPPPPTVSTNAMTATIATTPAVIVGATQAGRRRVAERVAAVPHAAQNCAPLRSGVEHWGQFIGRKPATRSDRRQAKTSMPYQSLGAKRMTELPHAR
jgi:hypothetical protein